MTGELLIKHQKYRQMKLNMSIKIIQSRDLGDEQRVAQDIHAMQKESTKEVPFMRVLDVRHIQELIRNGSMRCICNAVGEILSTLYLRDISTKAQDGRDVYALGGLIIPPEKRKEFMTHMDESMRVLMKTIEESYAGKVLVSQTHEKFRPTLIEMGFKEISLEEISENFPELLTYFTERHPDILRFIRE